MLAFFFCRNPGSIFPPASVWEKPQGTKGVSHMHQRWIALLLCLLLLFPACALAAATPREIIPLAPEDVPQPTEGMHHYLLLCTDTWDGDPNNLGNTDGVVLVTLDTVQRRVIFCTLTREMLIRRPDGAIGRFTYITKNYGIDALLNIVATQFGIKVDQYAIFCMNNIQDIIDALGGVTLTVTDAEADYLNRYRIARDATTPSMAKAGTYLFSGHAAVIYMRIRKVGGDGDAGRTRRIRTVLTTLTEKYADATLDDALRILGVVSDSLVTTNMKLDDMLTAVGYALELRGVTPEGYQLPPGDCLSPITYVGMQTYQVDFDRCRQYIHDIFYPAQ